MSCTPSGATLTSGALYAVCLQPSTWNGDLVVFIPGYTDPASTPRLPTDLAGDSLVAIVTRLGFALATTTFRGSGLIEPDTWIGGDLVELVQTAKASLSQQTGRATRRVYQTGGSQGGLGTVLALERHPSLFSGGLAACGPIGSYRGQLDYVADVRLLFDHFFAPVIPNWPMWTEPLDPTDTDPAQWTFAQQAIRTAVADPANASRIDQVLKVTGAPVQAGDPATVLQTTEGVLRYSFRGSADAIAKLGGVPFDNTSRSYVGSLDDVALNAGVQRIHFTADPARTARLETSGRLSRPLVTMHTSGDPIVPGWQQPLYRTKLNFVGRLLHTPIAVNRYGHCSFTTNEYLAGFALLVLKVTGHNLLVDAGVFPSAADVESFKAAAREYGASPVIKPR